MADLLEDLLQLGHKIKDYALSQNESIKIETLSPTADDATLSANTQLFLLVLYCTTLMLSLFENIVVIGVQLYCYTSQPFQNIKKYLINLALSDITNGVLCVPFIFSDLVLAKWTFPRWFCAAAQFVQLLSVFVTSNTLMMMGIERYAAVRRPFSKFYDALIAQTNLLLALVWSTGCVYAFIPVQHEILSQQTKSANQTFYQCDSFVGFSQTGRRFFQITNFVLTFLMPVIVLIFTYTSIVKILIKKNKTLDYIPGHSTTSRLSMERIQTGKCLPTNTYSVKRPIKRNRNKSKAIRTILTIVTLHVLCGTPIKIYQLLHEYGFIQYYSAQQGQGQLLLYIICHWIAMANSFLDPIGYTFTSERFRNDLRQIVNTHK